MDLPARTIDDFIIQLKQSKLQLALVTPTASFIGSHLAEALLAQNLAVLCEVIPNSKTKNYVKHLLNNPNFFLLEHTHQHDLPINLPPPKYIVYDVQETLNHFAPNEDISFSLSLETKRLVEYAVYARATFLLLSTVDPELNNLYQLPKPQEHTLSLETQKHQAELKHFVQTLITESIHKSALNARVVLYTDVYGPRMDLEVPSFMVDALRSVLLHEPVTVSGDGLSILRPLYITDFIYGVIKALLLEDTRGKTYTLVSPQEATYLNFATALQQAAMRYGVSVDVTFSGEPAVNNFAKRPVFDVLSVQELFWQPKVNLSEGLTKTLGFFFPPQTHPPVQPATVASPVAPQTPLVPPKEATIHTEAQTVAQNALAEKPEHQEIVPYEKKPLGITKIKKLPEFLNRRKPVVDSKPPKALIKKDETESKPPSKHRRIGWFLGIMCILIGLAILLPTIFVSVLQGYTQKTIEQALAESASQATITKALQMINLSQSTAELLVLPHVFLTHANPLVANQLYLSTVENTLEAKLAVQKGYELLDGLWRPTNDVPTTLHEANMQVTQAKEHAMLATAEQKALPVDKSTKNSTTVEASMSASSSAKAATTTSDISRAMQSLSQSVTDLSGLSQSTQLLSTLFGSKKERTFAVLLVDNSELRPAGGLVEGLFAVSIKLPQKPAITSLDPTSTAVNPKIDAPQDMKTYLRQSTVSFENSLWQYDFAKATSPFVAGLGSLTGKPIDGVISLDYTALKKLLELTGPMLLDTNTQGNGEKTRISSDNFDKQLAQLYKNASLPTGERRHTFTRELTAQVLEKLLTEKQSFKSFMQAVTGLYTTQHMSLSFVDATLSDLAERNKWSAALKPTTSDYIGVYDSNISLNKVNTVVKRIIHHDVAINANNEVTERIVVTYTNEAETVEWPFGTYQTYTKVLLPKDRKVSVVTVDDKKPKQAPERMEGETSQTIGTLVTVPPKAKVQLTIEFKQPNLLLFANNQATLMATVIKQAGTVADPYELALHLPQGYSAKSTMQSYEQFADGILTKAQLDRSKSSSFIISKP